VCRLLVVWCLGWFRFLAFPCLCQYRASSVLSIREQRRPDRSCGEVSVIATKKKKDRTERCMLYLVSVVSVFGSVPLLASVDRVSEIVQPAVKVYCFFVPDDAEWMQRRNETQTESCILFVLVGAMVVSLCLVLHQWIAAVKSCAACSEGVLVFRLLMGSLHDTQEE